MKINKGDFVVTGNDAVYKMLEDHLLLMSPNYNNEDRRLFDFEAKNIKLIRISKEKAIEKINKQFSDFETEWEFDGKAFKVLKNSEKNSTFANYKGDFKGFCRDKVIFYRDKDNKVHQYAESYHLGWFRGKIYWFEITQYFPRIYLYKFTDIDVFPHWEDGCQWTNAKHLKIIYDAKTNKPI